MIEDALNKLEKIINDAKNLNEGKREELINLNRKTEKRNNMKPKTIKYKIIAGNNIEKSLFLECLLQVTPSPKDLCKLYLEFSDIKYLAELRETRIERAAREIMGGNYIGRRELAEIFGDILMGEEIEHIPALPVNIIESLLKLCPFTKDKTIAETHLLVMIPKSVGGDGISIIRWKTELLQRAKSQHAKEKFYNLDWYDKEGFAKEKIEAGWYLVPKFVCSGTHNQNYGKQEETIQPYIKEGYRTARAGELVTVMLMYNLKTGKNDLFNCRDANVAWCKEQSGGGVRVGVYFDDDGGLRIYYYSGGHRYGGLGRGLLRNF